MLDLVLKQDDPERSFVEFKKDDEIVLLLNNQGGMSTLEMGAICDEVLTQLGECRLVRQSALGWTEADKQRNRTSSQSGSLTDHSWAR